VNPETLLLDPGIRQMTRLYALAVFVAVLLAGARAQTTDAGRQAFLAHCVGCHGDNGTGGGHGPDIVNVAQPRGTSKDAVRDLILKGIPEVGMPAFQIPIDQADAIAAYVMVLKGASTGPPAPRQAAPGDPLAGEAFFAGKGNCTSCHMVRGLGGVLGPDLSNVGDNRTLAQIEQALADPGSAESTRGGPSYRAVTVRLRDGETVRGIAKNQSAFDLQLLGVDGKLYLLVKDQVASVISEKSLMPKVEATPAELRDLLAYLSRLSMDANATFTNPTAKFKMSDAAGTGGGIRFADVAHPKTGSWPTYHGNESGNRFSPLNQINTSNVGQLAPKWMFTMGAPTDGPPKVGVPSWSGLEVTPIVVDGVMYVTSVNEAYALDARSGRQIWHYSRPRSPGLAGDTAGGINRGVAVLGDRVFMVTDNAHVIALHRLTGQLLWDAKMADPGGNYGATGAPLVVNDLVISGVSGGDEGIRGFLDAYKASTGEHVWRFWTVPAPGEPGSETWVGRAIEHGCAATWLTGTYDAETNLLYWPTGNP
jgi:putative heme-binding domain-containing protein